MQLHATLFWNQLSLPLCALIDSGADESFMDANLATESGKILAFVTHQSVSLQLILSGKHQEFIHFHLIPSPGVEIVLGHPRLKVHNL